ncbi:MAG: hypothetical protein EOP45_15520 [Sphingobacteriaceae bacterium]|nr:MAG: hypothetical protein EOP45_15520 [Sphingobacteriaceae bacterium]
MSPILYYGYTLNVNIDEIRSVCEIDPNLHIRSNLFTVHEHLKPTPTSFFTHSVDKAIEYQKKSQFNAEQWIRKRQNPREAIVRAYWSKKKTIVAEVLVDGHPYYLTLVHNSGLGTLQNLKKLVSSGRLGPRIEICPALKATVHSMCVRE